MQSCGDKGRVFVTIQRILLAQPRGFCAGVEMSVKALIWLTRTLPHHRIYCFHEIVHNEMIVDWFEKRSVTFINELEDIPRKHDDIVALMLSAHGTDPKIVAEARARFQIVIDSACPLVTKVHNELRHAESQGSVVIYLGDPAHDEGAGTLGAAQGETLVVQPRKWREDVEALPDLSGRTICFLTQTTLSQDLHDLVLGALIERFGELSTPAKSDLCFATTNRQNAVREMARECDHIIVVGSVQSANTRSLYDIARSSCASVYWINDVAELPSTLNGTVGVTAGASAPETLVEEVCMALNPALRAEAFLVTEESEYFRPPSDLRRLAARIGDLAYYDPLEDVHISVSDLLRTL